MQARERAGFVDARWLTTWEAGGGCNTLVMAGLDPAIHAFALTSKKDVDARDKRGHDG
jgi:hypothetical protein